MSPLDEPTGALLVALAVVWLIVRAAGVVADAVHEARCEPCRSHRVRARARRA